MNGLLFQVMISRNNAFIGFAAPTDRSDPSQESTTTPSFDPLAELPGGRGVFVDGGGGGIMSKARLFEEVSIEPIRSLLKATSRNSAEKVDELLAELKPECFLDRDSNDNFFAAQCGKPNKIFMGVQCSVRLQIQAYAAGIIVTTIYEPSFAILSQDERHNLLAQVDVLLNWSVGVDITRILRNDDVELDLNHPLHAEQGDLPVAVYRSLTEEQRIVGEGVFRFACAWILLHELAHLKFKHVRAKGIVSQEQEGEADRFAAEWLSNAAFGSKGDVQADRLSALIGIAVALLWLTVFNVFFGQKQYKGDTHPQPYQRLFQVLDSIVDQENSAEYDAVWDFIATMLRIHMASAGFDFDCSDSRQELGVDRRGEASHLIDRISRFERGKRSAGDFSPSGR